MAHGLLYFLVVWTLLDMAVALLLGAAGHLDMAALVVVETALGIGGIICVCRGSDSTARRDFGERPFVPLERLLVATVGGLGVAILLRLARTPTTDYDSLLYHLTAVAEYYQKHSFVDLPSLGMGSGFIGRYPFGWEALSTLFVISFRDDFLVTLPNLVAAAVFAISTYLLSLDLGARRLAALAAVALLLSGPVISMLMFSLHVDLALAAFFVAGLYGSAVLARSKSGVDAGLPLAAVAVVCGVKTSGLVYGPLVLATACVLARWTRWPPSSPAEHAGPERVALIFVTVAATWVGTFWYARNFIDVGNPVGDVQVKVGNTIVFPGTLTREYLRRTTLLSCFNISDPHDWAILFRVLRANLGLPFAVLAALAVVWRPGQLDSDPGKKRARLVLTGIMAGTALLYCLTPFSGGNANTGFRITPWVREGLRYAVPFLGTLGVLAALGATRLGRTLPLVGVVAALVAIREARGWYLHSPALLIAAIWGTWVVVDYVRSQRRPRSAFSAAIAACLLVVAFVVGSLRLRHQHSEERMRRYGSGAAFVETLGPDDVIGHFLDREPYLLYGRFIDRRVTWVPSASDGLDAWIAELRRRRVRWIAVGPLSAGWKRRQADVRELGWIKSNPNVFVPVHGRGKSDETTFYRLADPSAVPHSATYFGGSGRITSGSKP